ncbi:MAG: Gfo/Idh/MocA family oxidoreductase [Candidatus Altiarchaeota archaeon]|nr:Gfo/Idh/MocA family oxidoreductase [Candidatus Altiarchaeota archaeon]
MIKVGVIGAGAMGGHHARVYAGMKDVELVGIADLQKERAEALAKRYSTSAYTDYGQLLSEKPDAVTIAVPTVMHKDVALSAIQKGINILLEKPIADTVANADEIILKADDAQIKLMVGHIERFNPVVLKLKEEIDSGSLGKVVAMSTVRVGPYNPRIRDVGIIIDLGVHDIDIMSFLYSEKVRSVHSYAGCVIHKFEDYASILLGFKNGNSGIIETNWLTPHKTRTLTVTGTKAIAYADYMDQTLKICDERGETAIKLEKKEPLANELEHFVSCVRDDVDPPVCGRDARDALCAAIAAIRSYKEDKTINI